MIDVGDSATPLDPTEAVSRVGFLRKAGAFVAVGLGLTALGTTTKARAGKVIPSTWFLYTCCPTVECMSWCEATHQGNYGNNCSAGGVCGSQYNYCSCSNSYLPCYSYRTPSC